MVDAKDKDNVEVRVTTKIVSCSHFWQLFMEVSRHINGEVTACEFLSRLPDSNIFPSKRSLNPSYILQSGCLLPREIHEPFKLYSKYEFNFRVKTKMTTIDTFNYSENNVTLVET